ncbi:MAG: sodium/glutamate symporter [Sedimentitalea sp.]
MSTQVFIWPFLIQMLPDRSTTIANATRKTNTGKLRALPLAQRSAKIESAPINTVPVLLPKIAWPARTKPLAIVSDDCLSVFLAMSLMSLQLWTLTELGGPILFVFGFQVVMTIAFIVLVFFRLMGRTYQGAVLSAGFEGCTLTPTAIANMSSVTKRYGPAPLDIGLHGLVDRRGSVCRLAWGGDDPVRLHRRRQKLIAIGALPFDCVLLCVCLVRGVREEFDHADR